VEGRGRVGVLWVVGQEEEIGSYSRGRGGRDRTVRRSSEGSGSQDGEEEREMEVLPGERTNTCDRISWSKNDEKE